MAGVLSIEERIKEYEARLLNEIRSTKPNFYRIDGRYFNPNYFLLEFNEDSFNFEEEIFKKTVFFSDISSLQNLGEAALEKCLYAMSVTSDVSLSDAICKLLSRCDYKFSYKQFLSVFRTYGHYCEGERKPYAEGEFPYIERVWKLPYDHCILSVFNLLKLKNKSFSLEEKLSLFRDLSVMLKDPFIEFIKFKVVKMYCNLVDDICKADSPDTVFNIITGFVKTNDPSIYKCLQALNTSNSYCTLVHAYISSMLLKKYSFIESVSLKDLHQLFNKNNFKRECEYDVKSIIFLGLYLMCHCEYEECLKKNQKLCYEIIDNLECFANMHRLSINFTSFRIHWYNVTGNNWLTFPCLVDDDDDDDDDDE